LGIGTCHPTAAPTWFTIASMWMVRAGRRAEEADAYLQHGIVAFGGARLGKLVPTVTKDGLLTLYAEKYPEHKEASRGSWASQLLRLVVEMKIGDEVMFGDPERRRYVLGKITSDYEWLPDVLEARAHVRRVAWAHEVARDELSTSTKNTLGSIMTIFKVGAEAAADLHAHARPLGAIPHPTKPPPPKEAEKNAEDLGLLSAETFERANEFIEDQIDALDWSQMQDLVAGLLRAMGYRTTVSEPGPDRGVDVFASPDGLGLEDPRIFVEVKHRTRQIESKEIRAFVGARKKGDKCLYVSTGGFSKDAYYEAERAEVALTLVTLPRLRQLLVDLYEKLDAETRALVPLRRLYWPAVKVSG
jgi:restriction system protein